MCTLLLLLALGPLMVMGRGVGVESRVGIAMAGTVIVPVPGRPVPMTLTILFVSPVSEATLLLLVGVGGLTLPWTAPTVLTVTTTLPTDDVNDRRGRGRGVGRPNFTVLCTLPTSVSTGVSRVSGPPPVRLIWLR